MSQLLPVAFVGALVTAAAVGVGAGESPSATPAVLTAGPTAPTFVEAPISVAPAALVAATSFQGGPVPVAQVPPVASPVPVAPAATPPWVPTPPTSVTPWPPAVPSAVPANVAPWPTAPQTAVPANVAPWPATPQAAAPANVAPWPTAPRAAAPTNVAPWPTTPPTAAPANIAPWPAAPQAAAPTNVAPWPAAPQAAAPANVAPRPAAPPPAQPSAVDPGWLGASNSTNWPNAGARNDPAPLDAAWGPPAAPLVDPRRFTEAHWQGMELIPNTPRVAQGLNLPPNVRGVIVDDATLPADIQGFQAGDLVTRVAGVPTPHLMAFIMATDLIRDQTRADVEIVRAGQTHVMPIAALRERLGTANGETPPMIPAGARMPHPYRGPCTNCHRIGTTGALAMDQGDPARTTGAPIIRAGSRRPHRDRGPCLACHQIVP